MPKIQNKIIKTRYIEEALNTFAEQNLIPPSECDFFINKVDTYIKSNANDSFELYSKDVQKNYMDKEKILNEHVEFHQIYTITAMHKEKQEIELEYTIDYSKYSTHPLLILSPDSKIPYKTYKPVELLKLLFKEFNKIKAFHKILINIFDEDMKKYLKLLVKYIYASKFIKRVKIPLFNGIKPVITRPSKLIFWFKEKEHKSEVIEVQENELLVEYKKPIYGQNGLNAFGEYIDTTFANNVDDLQARVDEKSIKIIENTTTKKYISKIRGYVHYDGTELLVDNRIKISEISRHRDLVDDLEDNNIEVVVTQHDTARDTIKEGVTLISERIHVDGFVGAKSRLEAVTLEIDGATHQDSAQYAKYATINRHKGTLRCHEGKIKLLDGGVVYATTVDIESSIGGAIYAQDVTIGHVKNNLKVYASNSITVRLVSGEDNLFKINYRDIPILQSKIKFIENDLKELKYKLEEAKRHSLSRVEEIEKEIQNLKSEKKAIQNSYQTAKITVKEPFKGLNNIVFTIDDTHQIAYKTDAKAYPPFYLEIKENIITLHPVAKSIVIEE
jgi:hypothetical protein